MRSSILPALLAVLFLAPGCPDPTPTKEETGETGTSIYDADNDGYTFDEDCDDEDPAIHPDAPELCDGLDNDCDLEIDDGAGSTWFRDADDDSWGDPTDAAVACDQPDGSVSDGTDCDDSDPTVFPGNPEICDGLDNDCDDLVDEDLTTTWYADADDDGFGDASTSTLACEPVPGFVADGTDCDDTHQDVNPATVEVCDLLDNDCDGSTDEDLLSTWYSDLDYDTWGDDGVTIEACDPGSGWVAVGGDCDNTNSAINPGAIEVCDHLDDDCDGLIDEDGALPAIWYLDADQDGFGDPSISQTTCEIPPGYVLVAGDCDDDASAVNPAASEYCNGIDDDCDKVADEPDAIDVATWYLDADGDGFGDPALPTMACMAPADHVSDATDCDDTLASVNPGATEICEAIDAAGTDEDCDGSVDEGDAADAPTWYRDLDGDGFGDALVTQVSCSQPIGFVLDGGDCDDTSSATWPSASEVCDQMDNDCDGEIDEEATDMATWYRDGDGDGFGASTDSIRDCALPSGYSSQGGDCDDASALVNPSATEICNSLDDDCDGIADDGFAFVTWYMDADGDSYGDPTVSVLACAQPVGFVSSSTDCDDSQASVHLGAAERCNGADDDCDTIIDEGIPFLAWYLDSDGDGFGDSASSIRDCAAPSGYVGNRTDCDDEAAGVFPGATETCNAVDDDCDGMIDDGLVIPTWYRDADSDGFGNPSVSVTACGAPSGYLADSTDCNDANAALNPGATEVCNALDDDCDGLVDDGFSTTSWYQDADGDGYGNSAISRVACSAPSGFIATSGDCDDTSPTVFPGANEICANAVDDDCDGTPDDGCILYTDHCGAITTTTTWTSGTVHRLTCDVYVQGGANAILTIEDGTEVVSNAGYGLYVGWNSMGRLLVNGTSIGVTFGSTRTVPAPGDWKGIFIGSYDQGSLIDGATIEYGGYVGNGGVVLSFSSPIISNSLIQYNAAAGIYGDGSTPVILDTLITDNAGSGYYAPTGGLLLGTAASSFAGNTVTGNDGYPVSILSNYAGEIDGSCTLAGNTSDFVMLSADIVEDSATWHGIDVPFRMQGSHYIQGSNSPELIIEDGVELAFNMNSGLYVGWTNHGSIDVQGAQEGVLFTSSDPTPAAGDWVGVYVGQFDLGSHFENASFEYGGSTAVGNLYLNYSNATVSGCTFSDSAARGMYVAAAFPPIEDSTFQDNAMDGLYITSSGGLMQGYVSDGNSFIDNGEYALSIPADYIGELGPDTLIGGNGFDHIRVWADTVERTATWHAQDVPYRFVGQVYVQGPSQPVVTIEDGADLLFDQDMGLYVGWSNYSGALATQGTSLGVHFDSSATAPSAGDWRGIYFGTYNISASSILEGIHVEHAGRSAYGGIYAYRTVLTLTDCVLEDNAASGIYVNGATIDMSGCRIAGNTGYGVRLESNAGLATAGSPTFTDNVVTGNTGSPIQIPANYVGQLDASSTFTGNGTDSIEILADSIEIDATWQALGVPFVVKGIVYVQGTSYPQLTIDPGTTIRFDTNMALYVGWYAYGGLRAEGTVARPILFTTSGATPTRGSWYGVNFGSYCVAAESILRGVTVEYGGGNLRGDVWLYYCNATVADSTISNSGWYGIYRNTSAYGQISNIAYSNNTAGNLY